jgi:Flp pilus assembly protein TadG
MFRRFRCFLTDTCAAAAIEFALISIPLVLLLFGGITYGGVLASKIALEHAASEGARAGIAGLTLCERKDRAEAVARDALLFGSLAASAVVEATATEEQIRVDITYNYAANPLSPVLFPVPDQLTAHVVVLTDGPELAVQSC